LLLLISVTSELAMGRAPCCDKASVKKGPWSPDEDATLKKYLENHGTGGNWIALPHKAGLSFPTQYHNNTYIYSSSFRKNCKTHLFFLLLEKTATNLLSVDNGFPML
jgi:hypothetical protein